MEIDLHWEWGRTKTKEPAAPAPSEDPAALQLALARTSYNYMRSYPNLEDVPLCASVPSEDNFSADFDALVLRSNLQIAQNYLAVVEQLLGEEIANDERWLRLKDLFADVETALAGLGKLAQAALAKGPTAFLQLTLDDMLRKPGVGLFTRDPDLLQAKSEQDYRNLLQTLPRPQMLDIPSAKWMPADGLLPCEQDWFFGWLQVAGFNTTNLRGVARTLSDANRLAMSWDELQRKLPIDDGVFQRVTGSSLASALDEGRLYVVDYTGLIGNGDLKDKESDFNGKHRYLPSPVALFYWADQAPGYPPAGFGGAGVLQAVAITLDPAADGAIFTPNDAAHANDKRGWKWRIAKYFVNVAAAIQHESVAHLGNCHFILESIILATHRQLPQDHSLFKLLAPHFKFTLRINGGALQTLIAPGGVVATNVGPNIHWTLELVNQARKAWRWNEHNPERFFTLRGVDTSRLPAFPFRDDTTLLWKATRTYVASYVEFYYATDDAVVEDVVVKAWFEELISPAHGNLQGLAVPRTRDELVDALAQIIHTAGPLHASVNYAQYPLGAYMPSVAATIYHAAPTREDDVDHHSFLKWLPPLDVALYTISFEYLLSSVQYDTFGHYSGNPHFKWFPDHPLLQDALDEFQTSLARAEVAIREQNLKRPMPYTFQLPSRIPNSISI